MTAPDVRTAAQAEAERRVKPSPTPLPGGGSTDVTQRDRDTFIAGAVWGAALVTPTREQVARELYKTFWGDLVTWEEDSALFYDYADAVLALMRAEPGR